MKYFQRQGWERKMQIKVNMNAITAKKNWVYNVELQKSFLRYVKRESKRISQHRHWWIFIEFWWWVQLMNWTSQTLLKYEQFSEKAQHGWLSR